MATQPIRGAFKYATLYIQSGVLSVELVGGQQHVSTSLTAECSICKVTLDGRRIDELLLHLAVHADEV